MLVGSGLQGGGEGEGGKGDGDFHFKGGREDGRDESAAGIKEASGGTQVSPVPLYPLVYKWRLFLPPSAAFCRDGFGFHREVLLSQIKEGLPLRGARLLHPDWADTKRSSCNRTAAVGLLSAKPAHGVKQEIHKYISTTSVSKLQQTLLSPFSIRIHFFSQEE